MASEIVTYEDPENPGGESQTNSQNELNTANEENEKSEDLEAIKNGLDPSNNKSNPVFTNLTNILTKLGLEENKDFTQEQLKQKHAIEDYYDMDAIASVQQGSTAESGSPRLVTRLRYWYHPNYLGNVDMITDLNGEVNQYYVYSPFGENLYEWSANTLWNTPYRFNGKELDPETGNQYYGARYYDPKISVWLSVDPWANKYLSFTPYNFVANNPIQLVDPDGRGIKPVGKNADLAFNKLLESYTTEFKELFGLKQNPVTVEGEQLLYVYTSNHNYEDYDAFKKAARKHGVPRRMRKAAYLVWKELNRTVHKEIQLVATNNDQDEGDNSSKGGSLPVPHETKNKGLKAYTSEIHSNPENTNRTTINLLNGAYNEDNAGTNWLYFQDNYERDNFYQVDNNKISGLIILNFSSRGIKILNQALQDALTIL